MEAKYVILTLLLVGISLLFIKQFVGWLRRPPYDVAQVRKFSGTHSPIPPSGPRPSTVRSRQEEERRRTDSSSDDGGAAWLLLQQDGGRRPDRHDHTLSNRKDDDQADKAESSNDANSGDSGGSDGGGD